MQGLSSWMVIPAAFVLDMLLGDPHRFPHPVRWMGRAIVTAEPWFRRLPVHPALAGGGFAAVLVAGPWWLAALLIDAGRSVQPFWAGAIEVVMVYFCLSARSLNEAAMEIFTLLNRHRAADARERLALIVGRDVDRYQPHDMARAAVETVAENFVDGVLSPLLFAAVGGAPLAMAFKMASTLDSMVGYQNERYYQFGKASARLDDVLNFVPARVSVPIIALAAQILSGSGVRALKTARSEGRNHTSPNAGRPEAAFAGALQVKLNGPNTYGGTLVNKPYIGIGFAEVRIKDIKKACDLMMLSTLFSVAVAAALALAFISG